MAKAMRSVRRVRTTHKDKKLRLPLPPSVHEFAAGYALLNAELSAAIHALPENASAREVYEATQAKLNAYVDSAITKHIGRITADRHIEPRPPRTLDDIVIAAAIVLESPEARNALVSKRSQKGRTLPSLAILP